MTTTRQIMLALLSLCLLLSAACDNKKKSAPAAEESAKEETKPEDTGNAAAAESDYIIIEATHAEPKPSDPAVFEFGKFRVTEAIFDTANLEGATATVEIDVSSLKSDKAARDKHVRNPDFLDTKTHPTATIKVADVLKQDEHSYSATLAVSLHGQEATWEVDFVVADKTDKSVTIELQHTFERREFGIGKEEDSPAQELLAKVRLTFKR